VHGEQRAAREDLDAGVPCKSAVGTYAGHRGGGVRTITGRRRRRWQTHQGVSLLGRGNMPPCDHFQTAVVLDKLGKLLESCCQTNYRRAAAVTWAAAGESASYKNLANSVADLSVMRDEGW